jgi:hypothetical protein
MDIGVYVRCSMGTRVYVAGAVWIPGVKDVQEKQTDIFR